MTKHLPSAQARITTEPATRHKITLDLDSTTTAILAAATARGGFISRQDFIRALIIHNEEAPLHALQTGTAYFNGWINALRQMKPDKPWSKRRLDAEIEELTSIVEQMENQSMKRPIPTSW